MKRRNELIQRDIDEWDSQQQYEDELDHLTDENSKKLHRVLLHNITKMKFIYWPQVLMRPIQRRLGLW